MLIVSAAGLPLQMLVHGMLCHDRTSVSAEACANVFLSCVGTPAYICQAQLPARQRELPLQIPADPSQRLVPHRRLALSQMYDENDQATRCGVMRGWR